jgi:hypothetical protein
MGSFSRMLGSAMLPTEERAFDSMRERIRASSWNRNGTNVVNTALDAVVNHVSAEPQLAYILAKRNERRRHLRSPALVAGSIYRNVLYCSVPHHRCRIEGRSHVKSSFVCLGQQHSLASLDKVFVWCVPGWICGLDLTWITADGISHERRS